jgi:hypothetical protein
MEENRVAAVSRGARREDRPPTAVVYEPTREPDQLRAGDVQLVRGDRERHGRGPHKHRPDLVRIRSNRRPRRPPDANLG